MMTVSALARQCGLSRTTLLYYESQGSGRSFACCNDHTASGGVR